MKRLLLLSVSILALTGCDDGKSSTQTTSIGFDVYPVKYNGHDFLYFQRKGKTAAGVEHDPECSAASCLAGRLAPTKIIKIPKETLK